MFADLLPLKDPTETFRGVSRTGPSAAHWFGADNIGHDVFSRAIYGARRSLFVAIVATAVGLLIGGTLGLIAGYYRRALDSTIAAVFNILLAIPALVFLLTVIAFLAPPGESSPTTQTFWTTLTLSILTVPIIGRDHPGADDGVGRPRLRDGLPHAGRPQQAHHAARDPAQRRPHPRLLRVHRSAPR